MKIFKRISLATGVVTAIFVFNSAAIANETSKPTTQGQSTASADDETNPALLEPSQAAIVEAPDPLVARRPAHSVSIAQLTDRERASDEIRDK